MLMKPMREPFGHGSRSSHIMALRTTSVFEWDNCNTGSWTTAGWSVRKSAVSLEYERPFNTIVRTTTIGRHQPTPSRGHCILRSMHGSGVQRLGRTSFAVTAFQVTSGSHDCHSNPSTSPDSFVDNIRDRPALEIEVEHLPNTFCSFIIHDKFSVLGSITQRHPPTHPSTCSSSSKPQSCRGCARPLLRIRTEQRRSTFSVNLPLRSWC